MSESKKDDLYVNLAKQLYGDRYDIQDEDVRVDVPSIQNVIKILSAREQNIIDNCYVKDKTIIEAGEILEMSPERAGEYHDRALRKLKRNSNTEIEPVLEKGEPILLFYSDKGLSYDISEYVVPTKKQCFLQKGDPAYDRSMNRLRQEFFEEKGMVYDPVKHDRVSVAETENTASEQSSVNQADGVSPQPRELRFDYIETRLQEKKQQSDYIESLQQERDQIAGLWQEKVNRRNKSRDETSNQSDSKVVAVVMPKKKVKIQHNNNKSTWENTAKEQIYLAPGSPEYEEYKNDLKEHDPFRSDDAFHNKLEATNSDYRAVLLQKSEQMQPSASHNKAILQQQKKGQFNAIRHKAQHHAEKTETTDDDQRTRSMQLDDLADIVFDDGVTSDDFSPKVLSKYL